MWMLVVILGDIVRRQIIVGYFSPLPLEEYDFGGGLDIGLSALEQLALFVGDEGDKLDVVGPVGSELVDPLQDVLGDLVEDGLDVDFGVEQLLGSDHALQHHFHVVLPLVVVHHSRTVDQVDALRQMHVLPHFRLSRNRRSLAHLLLLQRVYYAALTHVRVPDKPHADVLLVFVEVVELSNQIYQAPLTETILHTRMISDSRVLLLQIQNPPIIIYHIYTTIIYIQS